MKMVMTLTCSESGCLQYCKRAGAVLDAGALIARLELDDPSKVTTTLIFTGKFPQSDNVMPVVGDKLNQVYQSCKTTLENVFNGYCLPDPTERSNPSSLELQEVISSISGRIPASVEKKIRQLMTLYASNYTIITSVLSQFPSQQIASVIDSHAATLQKERTVTSSSSQHKDCSTRSALQDGIRGRMKSAVQELLRIYLGVETQFQHGHYDKCVQALRTSIRMTCKP
ncbi:Acetyl-CoA carboxylase, partial [Orchesella cincta]